MRDSYISRCQVIISVFDLIVRQGFVDQRDRIISIKEKNPSIRIILVGTKADLIGKGEKISEEEIKAFAEELQIPYFLTSAITKKNVDEVFEKCFELIHSKENKEMIEANNKPLEAYHSSLTQQQLVLQNGFGCNLSACDLL